MISARGAQNNRTIFAEVASLKARATCGGSLLTLPDIERAWMAACNVLRSQLLCGIPVTFVPKVISLYPSRRVVAVDGTVRYIVRDYHVGFSINFVTTYSLDAGVPREDAKMLSSAIAAAGGNSSCGLRLPIEEVARQAKMSAEMASDALREVFLYVGEGLYQGKLLELEFPGVVTMLMKRDRVVAKWDSSFLEAGFAIDSRKWPVVVKDMAIAAKKLQSHHQQAMLGGGSQDRPSSRSSSLAATGRKTTAAETEHDATSEGAPASSRPNSARAPSTARSSSSAPNTGRSQRTGGEIENNKPVFLTAAPRGLTFEDIAHRIEAKKNIMEKTSALKEKATNAKPLRGVPGLKLDVVPAGSPSGRKPHVDPMNVESFKPSIQMVNARVGEEDSIYSILTPGRMRDVAEAPCVMDLGYPPAPPTAVLEETVPVAEEIRQPVGADVNRGRTPSAWSSGPMSGYQMQAVMGGGDVPGYVGEAEGAVPSQAVEGPRRGKKRFQAATDGAGVMSAMTWVEAKKTPTAKRMYDDLA